LTSAVKSQIDNMTSYLSYLDTLCFVIPSSYIVLGDDSSSMLAVGRDSPGSNPTLENFLFRLNSV